MKCPFMKHRELVEFLTYLPWSLRNKVLKKVESKSDTLYTKNLSFENSNLSEHNLRFMYSTLFNPQNPNSIH